MTTQAKSDEIDEGTLATARVTEQDQARVAVELFERRETTWLTFGAGRGAQPGQVALLVAARSEERRIDSVEREARTRIGRGEGVDPAQRQFARRFKQAIEVSLAEVSYVFFSPAGGWFTLMTLPVPATVIL